MRVSKKSASEGVLTQEMPPTSVHTDAIGRHVFLFLSRRVLPKHWATPFWSPQLREPRAGLGIGIQWSGVKSVTTSGYVLDIPIFLLLILYPNISQGITGVSYDLFMFKLRVIA